MRRRREDEEAAEGTRMLEEESFKIGGEVHGRAAAEWLPSTEQASGFLVLFSNDSLGKPQACWGLGASEYSLDGSSNW